MPERCGKKFKLKNYNMIIRKLFTLGVALFAMGLFNLCPSASAQEQSSAIWQGTDISKLNENDVVFLYNVGTGRFLIHGGDWGTQARLFYNDTGKSLVVHKSGEYF